MDGCVLVQVELLNPVSPVHECLIIAVVIVRHRILRSVDFKQRAYNSLLVTPSSLLASEAHGPFSRRQGSDIIHHRKNRRVLRIEEDYKHK